MAPKAPPPAKGAAAPPPPPPPTESSGSPLKKVPPKVRWMLLATFGVICFCTFILMLVLYIQLMLEQKNPLEEPMKKLQKTMAEGLRNPKINYHNPIKLAEEVVRLPNYIERSENTYNDRKSKYQSLFKKGTTERLTLKSSGGWDVFEKSLYYISSDKKTWYDAENFCMSRDAHLASILTEEEQNYISSHITHPTWIGLTDENDQDNWEWIDGSRFLIQYWSHGSPSRSTLYGDKTQSCTCIVPSSSGYNWKNDNCHELHRWICKENLNVEEP